MSQQTSLQNAPGQSGDPHVLACIPEGRVRGLFSVLLTDQGCRVTACEDPAEAARQAQVLASELCIVQATERDDQAPVIRAARIRNPNTRVLVLAEHACAERLPALFKLGVDELLYLPANARRCMDPLRRLIAPQEPLEPAPEARPMPGPERTPLLSKGAPPTAIASGLSSSSPAMRTLLEHLRDVPGNAPGILLRGEAGSEFELVAREYHRLRGGELGSIPSLPALHFSEETLRDLIAMSRLSSEPVCTLHLQDLETLDTRAQEALRSVLTEERKRRHRGKPLAFVFSFNELPSNEDCPLMEELLFHTPNFLKIPPLRDRPEDLDGLARHLLGELSILYPASRVRTLEPGAREWLRMQIWPGNHAEFVELIRKAVLGGTSRAMGAMSLARLSAEEASPEKAV